MKQAGSERVRFYADWNWWPINRPHFDAFWSDNDNASWSISWGNGNSDPVWLLEVGFRVPRWMGRLYDWRHGP